MRRNSIWTAQIDELVIGMTFEPPHRYSVNVYSEVDSE